MPSPQELIDPVKIDFNLTKLTDALNESAWELGALPASCRFEPDFIVNGGVVSLAFNVGLRPADVSPPIPIPPATY